MAAPRFSGDTDGCLLVKLENRSIEIVNLSHFWTEIAFCIHSFRVYSLSDRMYHFCLLHHVGYSQLILSGRLEEPKVDVDMRIF